MLDSYGLKLRKLTILDEADALAANQELKSDQFDFLLDPFSTEKPWVQFLVDLEEESLGENLQPGRVRALYFVANVNGRIVGRTSIRLDLNDWLFKYGGHIGYAVRPADRRKGYANLILSQSLMILKTHGIDRALLTCDDLNLASQRTIEKNRGVLEDKVEREAGKLTRRYWIDLA
jgi:predicted acetyltransferase